MRTPVGWFTERVNGGVISDGAVVAYGEDLGLGEVELSFLDGFGPVSGDQVSVLAPAGIRGDDEVDPGDMLVLVRGLGSESAEISVTEGSFYEGPVSSFLPQRTWLRDDAPFEPSERWWPKRDDSVPGAGANVLLALGDHEPAEVFDASDTGNNPFDTGNNPFDTGNNPFDTGNNPFLIAVAGETLVANTLGQSYTPDELFDAGRPAPLGGATFGMSVLSTPDASVAGQSVNPLVGVETEALLQREEARRMLKQAGVTDADEVAWLSGPKVAYREGNDPDYVTELLGTETAIESFTGVVTGSEGPWWVGVHVARATPDDHVLTAGVQRTPLGTAKAAAKEGDTTLFAAREYMASVVERLVVE